MISDFSIAQSSAKPQPQATEADDNSPTGEQLLLLDIYRATGVLGQISDDELEQTSTLISSLDGEKIIEFLAKMPKSYLLHSPQKKVAVILHCMEITVDGGRKTLLDNRVSVENKAYFLKNFISEKEAVETLIQMCTLGNGQEAAKILYAIMDYCACNMSKGMAKTVSLIEAICALPDNEGMKNAIEIAVGLLSILVSNSSIQKTDVQECCICAIVSILNRIFNDDLLGREIIIKTLVNMVQNNMGNILMSDELDPEIITQVLCHESMNNENLIALFSISFVRYIYRPSNDFAACTFLRMAEKDSSRAIGVLNGMEKKDVTIIFYQSLPSPDVAFAFFEKIQLLSPGREIETFIATQRCYSDCFVTHDDNLFRFLLRVEKKDLDNSNEPKMLLKILLDERMEPRSIGDILTCNLIDSEKRYFLFEKIYSANPKKAIDVFKEMVQYSRSDKIIKILLKIEKDDSENPTAPRRVLEVFLDEIVTASEVENILANNSLPNLVASDLFEAMHLANPGKANRIFALMIYKRHIFRATKIFLKLYDGEINHQRTLGILCSDVVEPALAGIFFISNSLTDDKAMEIFKNLCVENFQKAFSIIKEIAQPLTYNLYSPDAVNKIALMLSSMLSTPEFQMKIARALIRMDQDKVDALLSSQYLAVYALNIRSAMAKLKSLLAREAKTLESAMRRYDEEFIIHIQPPTADAAGQSENQTASVAQAIGVGMGQIAIISGGEIPSGKNGCVDKILSAKSDTQALSHPGWLGKIFMGTAGKVLAAVAIIAGSGLALWAAILWPLAACIVAAGAAAALAAAIFSRN
ncbi:MAG: hypothetical protein LBI69_00885 [Puniceicoccales bacterium]|jgi:hypothetical protein|nr:hypothetical protein [Puniceicoccales bacterium]